jgi:hypothetical protein
MQGLMRFEGRKTMQWWPEIHIYELWLDGSTLAMLSPAESLGNAHMQCRTSPSRSLPVACAVAFEHGQSAADTS